MKRLADGAGCRDPLRQEFSASDPLMHIVASHMAGSSDHLCHSVEGPPLYRVQLRELPLFLSLKILISSFPDNDFNVLSCACSPSLL